MEILETILHFGQATEAGAAGLNIQQNVPFVMKVGLNYIGILNIGVDWGFKYISVTVDDHDNVTNFNFYINLFISLPTFLSSRHVAGMSVRCK